MKDYDRLLEILNLNKESEFKYVGENMDIGSFAVYGGQVLAQAVQAAYDSVDDDKTLHSLHAYFLHPGDKDAPIQYNVEIAKRGRSFDARRVLAKQNDSIIFVFAASFHIQEEGIEHQMSMPNVVEPESLATFGDLFARYNTSGIEPKGVFGDHGPFIFKPVELINPFDPGVRPPRINFWFKLNGNHKIEDARLKHSLLTYASDFNLLTTALLPHNMSFFTTPMQIASLDHAMWFYEEPIMDDYMLYSVESPLASNARATSFGKIFSRQGKLIASVVQEGLIRKL